MEQVLQRLRNQPLSQQLALAAAGCCLLATLTLVGVAAQSTQSIQNATLAEHADAAVIALVVFIFILLFFKLVILLVE